jgi:hypothetical protein
LQDLEKAIQEHITLTERRQNEALERMEELQEEPEDEYDGGAQRTLAIGEIDEQSRLLEADQVISGVISSQLRARLLGRDSGNTFNATFTGSNNNGMQIGYSASSITWNSNARII